MSTIDQEIVKARYELQDEDKTQYIDAMLVSFFNDSMTALASFLASINSDWVLGDSTEIISSGNNYLVLPSGFNTPLVVEINNVDLTRKTTSSIKKYQQELTAGTPEHYSLHKLNMIFERAVGSDTSVYIQYNEKPAVLALGDDMLYNDEFNTVIRGAAIMIAKNRNEYDLIGSGALHSFFSDAMLSNSIGRNRETRKNLGY